MLSLQKSLSFAQKLRRDGQWRQAGVVYLSALKVLGPSSSKAKELIYHHLAICEYGSGQFQSSLEYAQQALKLNPQLWQSGLVAANAMKSLGNSLDYAELISDLYQQFPEQPEVVVPYANVHMNCLGDAVGARQLVQPYLNHGDLDVEARTINLMSRLYDRCQSDTAQNLSHEIMAFAKQYLYLLPEEIAYTSVPKHNVPVKRKHRVGLLSPLFKSSPVYAFSFDVIKQFYEKGHELIFISRSHGQDWATDQFKQMATSWIDAALLSPAALHVLLKDLSIDELYEMGGWMDIAALRAVSIKPARLMYKWVGGQSCTTGLSSFDGFITDKIQTPEVARVLYSEPLMYKAGSYVKYTAASYLLPYKDRAQSNFSGRWAVIANPLKLSSAFLHWLSVLGQQKTPRVHPFMQQVHSDVKNLVLIDYRYQNAKVRQRIETVLRPIWRERLHFEMPRGHVGFIEKMCDVEGLIDTFPYSCGMTMAEALYVGIKVVFPEVSRQLFCERHGLAHVYYSQKLSS